MLLAIAQVYWGRISQIDKFLVLKLLLNLCFLVCFENSMKATKTRFRSRNTADDTTNELFWLSFDDERVNDRLFLLDFWFGIDSVNRGFALDDDRLRVDTLDWSLFDFVFNLLDLLNGWEVALDNDRLGQDDWLWLRHKLGALDS